jgi:hypothetical protein
MGFFLIIIFIKMEDTRYFNSLEHILDNSYILNNISLQGENNDFNLFTTRLS